VTNRLGPVGMHVQLLLDQPQAQYTNLDVVSGRVVLRVPNQTTISHILVKLEGTSDTRLLAPARPETREKPRHEHESHKLLYKIARVFPPANQAFDPKTRNAVQITPGTYEYPFSFKVIASSSRPST